jgi:hypothetical protein
MSVRRDQRRDKRDRHRKPESAEPLAPEALADIAQGPWRRIFPWDFPGQQADPPKGKPGNPMTEAGHPHVPTRDQLETLSIRLMHEYNPRFRAANMDLAIGRLRSLISRGIGLEMNGEWHSVKAARWSFVRRRWVLLNGLTELESAVKDYLEAQLSAPTA